MREIVVNVIAYALMLIVPGGACGLILCIVHSTILFPLRCLLSLLDFALSICLICSFSCFFEQFSLVLNSGSHFSYYATFC